MSTLRKTRLSLSSDRFEDTVTTIRAYLERGSLYVVAVDPKTREVIERGTAPAGLTLNFDAIIDA